MTRFDEFLSTLDVARSINSNGWTECIEDESVDFGTAERGYNLVETGLFLVLFARFEAEINALCETLIRTEKARPDWRERRAWEAYDDKRVSDIAFKRRLSLLIDKGLAIYADVGNLYSERNEIAHGAKLGAGIDMEKAIKTIKGALAAMEENP